MTEAISSLERTETGRFLLERARKLWRADSRKALEGHFQWGIASRTDAVLIRRFDPDTGYESRERKVTIFLRPEQHPYELILDMAHELVHATASPAWDPYDPNLSAVRYIQLAIEGEGGESAAVRQECQVGWELLSDPSRYKNKDELRSMIELRCAHYGTPPNLSEIQRDFYRVGRWKSAVTQALGADASHLPMLSSEKAVLYSSTGGAPYPASLLSEYRSLTRAACENMRKREEDQSPEIKTEQAVPSASDEIHSPKIHDNPVIPAAQRSLAEKESTRASEESIRYFLEKRCQPSLAR